MNIQFDIEGETQLHRRIKGIADGVKDWSWATNKIGQYLKGFFTNDVFQSEGAIIGEKWVGGPYYHRLERTGKMRNSFLYKNDKMQVEISNSAPYFKYHQSKLPRKKLPRRVMMKLDEKRKQTIVKFFQEQIITLANKNI
jgi:hypothetical protein